MRVVSPGPIERKRLTLDDTQCVPSSRRSSPGRTRYPVLSRQGNDCVGHKGPAGSPFRESHRLRIAPCGPPRASFAACTGFPPALGIRTGSPLVRRPLHAPKRECSETSLSARSRSSSQPCLRKADSPRGCVSPPSSSAAHDFSLDLSSPRRSRGRYALTQVEASDTVLEQILVSALEMCPSLRNLGEVRDYAREVLLLSNDKIFYRAVELFCRESLECITISCDLFFHVFPLFFSSDFKRSKQKGVYHADFRRSQRHEVDRKRGERAEKLRGRPADAQSSTERSRKVFSQGTAR